MIAAIVVAFTFSTSGVMVGNTQEALGRRASPLISHSLEWVIPVGVGLAILLLKLAKLVLLTFWGWASVRGRKGVFIGILLISANVVLLSAIGDILAIPLIFRLQQLTARYSLAPLLLGDLGMQDSLYVVVAHITDPMNLWQVAVLACGFRALLAESTIRSTIRAVAVYGAGFLLVMLLLG